MIGFMHNQPAWEVDCLWRCLYAVLRTAGKTSLPYRVFLKEARRTVLFRRAGSLADAYSAMDAVGIGHRLTRWVSGRGLYLIVYPHGDTYHCVAYEDGVLYDSTLDGPKALDPDSLDNFLALRVKPGDDRECFTVEIFVTPGVTPSRETPCFQGNS